MITITALITRRNKPKEITVIGNVKRTRIGLTSEFKIPKIKATINAVQIFSTCTPGKI